jgi:peptidoglycan hydrolase-like protein with peptidoglycan-binding domain
MSFHLFKSGLGLKTVGVLVGLSLSGCDYWPPALHHEIEELRNDLNDALDERQRVNNDNAELRSLQDSLRREAEEKERDNEALRSRLAKLTSDPARPTAPIPAPKPPAERPSQTLMKGAYVELRLTHPPMKGPKIARVQRLLRQEGFPIRIDGVYGRDTEAAVRGFQRSHRLVADGSFGPATEELLRRSTNPPKLVRQLWLKRPPLTGQDVRSVQSALRKAGHRVTVDGHYGPETDIAVTRFQRRHGLDSNGVVDPHTWAMLMRKR